MSTQAETTVFAGNGHENPSLMMWSGKEEIAKPLIISQFSYDYSIYALAVSPNGTKIAAGTKPGLLRVHSLSNPDVSENSPVLFEVFHLPGVVSLAFCTDDILASGGLDGRIKFWSISEKSQLAEIQAHTNGVFALCQMGSLVLASIGGDNVLRIWDLDTLKTGYESEPVKLPKIRGLTSLDYSFVSGLLMHPSGNGDLHIYDPHNNFAKRVIHAHEGNFCALACGSEYVVTAGTEDAIIKLWPTPMDKPVAEASAPLGVLSAAWAGTNSIMTVYADGSGQVWKADGTLLPGPRIGSLGLRCTIGMPTGLVYRSQLKNSRQWRDEKLSHAKEIITDPENFRQVAGIAEDLCQRGFSAEAALIMADAAKAQNKPLLELQSRLALAEGLGNSKAALPSLYALGKLLRRLKEPGLAQEYFEKILQIDENYPDVKEQIAGLQSDPLRHLCPDKGIRGDLTKEGQLPEELQKDSILNKKFTWQAVVKEGKTKSFNTHLNNQDVADSVSTAVRKNKSDISSVKLTQALLFTGKDLRNIIWVYVSCACEELPIAFALEIRSDAQGSEFIPYEIFDAKLLKIPAEMSAREHNQQVEKAFIKLRQSSDARNWLMSVGKVSVDSISQSGSRSLAQNDDEY